MQKNNYNSYKGFPLFNDVADIDLRNRNRAQILTNIAQDNVRDRKISVKGSALILGYFGLVEPNDRDEVQELFKRNMLANGFAL